jgi:hypothetical protein
VQAAVKSALECEVRLSLFHRDLGHIFSCEPPIFKYGGSVIKLLKNLSAWIETQKKVFFKDLTLLTGGSKDVDGEVIEKMMGDSRP